MKPEIRARFNERILQQALERYGTRDEQARALGGFESFIYEFQRDGDPGDYILRIGHSQRRDAALIQGEVDWINYLASGGAGVARAVPSQQGNLVEPIADGHGHHFLATAFTRAAGAPPRPETWTPAFIETYGQALGKIHALSMAYEPTPPGWRPHWNDPIMLDVTANLPPEETAVASRMHELQQYLQTLPKTPDSYGMIHFDPHGGNFFVADSGQITFFDFDDCAFGHFIYDVALTVFYGVIGQEDEVAWTDAFLTHFLRGYRREKALADAWVAEIPYFLKLREIDLYAVIHRSFDVDNIDNPWVAGFMEGRRQRIEEGVPFLDFDFGNG